jgi:hypothetical protein
MSRDRVVTLSFNAGPEYHPAKPVMPGDVF